MFYFWELVGHTLRFPDTSNTCYQSYCDAAAKLLVHQQEYLDFLEIVRDQKEWAGFNHMEENMYIGPWDIPTITKMATLALYAQAVTHPYTVTSRPKRRVTCHNDPRCPAFGSLSHVTAASTAFACGPAPVTPLNGIFGRPVGPHTAFCTGWSQSPTVVLLFGLHHFVSRQSHPKPSTRLVGKLQYVHRTMPPKWTAPWAIPWTTACAHPKVH